MRGIIQKNMIDIQKLDRTMDDVIEILRTFFPLILAGDTAYSIVKNTRPKEEKITFQIRHTDWTKFAKNMLLTVLPQAKITDKNITFDFNGVPIEIKLVKRDKYLKRPDMVIYNHETYWIPNPFDKYWKARGLVS